MTRRSNLPKDEWGFEDDRKDQRLYAPPNSEYGKMLRARALAMHRFFGTTRIVCRHMPMCAPSTIHKWLKEYTEQPPTEEMEARIEREVQKLTSKAEQILSQDHWVESMQSSTNLSHAVSLLSDRLTDVLDGKELTESQLKIILKLAPMLAELNKSVVGAAVHIREAQQVFKNAELERLGGNGVQYKVISGGNSGAAEGDEGNDGEGNER